MTSTRFGGGTPLVFGAAMVVAGAATAAPAVPPHPTARYQTIAGEEAAKAGLPAAIADAVMAIESGYDPTLVGGVGEIGLMQVRPATARMLGFAGSDLDLAKPEVNIHYGVAYLAEAWRRAGGDLCRALMKYRAGHGQDIMTARSVTYCARARDHLASTGSPFAAGVALPPVAGAIVATHGALGRPLRGVVLVATRRARIQAINAMIDERRRTMADGCRAANVALDRMTRRKDYVAALRASVKACAIRVAVR